MLTGGFSALEMYLEVVIVVIVLVVVVVTAQLSYRPIVLHCNLKPSFVVATAELSFPTTLSLFSQQWVPDGQDWSWKRPTTAH